MLLNLNIKKTKTLYPRAGCHDLWNAYMVKGAIFSTDSDMPLCPCKANEPPVALVSYEDAKALYKKEIKAGNIYFHKNAYIHFYIDDQKFDGKQSSIWLYPEKSLEIIKHFAGIISPDFSTNADFPDPWKRFNTYRMRAFGFWVNSKGIAVINNVRWGTIETWNYCFDGIPHNSIVCIRTVASGLRNIDNRPLFESGMHEMVKRLSPHTIVIYGSSNYSAIKELENEGLRIVTFPSKTSLAFERRANHE